MLYNLLYPLSVDYSILNIFKYITFRSAWAPWLSWITIS